MNKLTKAQLDADIAMKIETGNASNRDESWKRANRIFWMAVKDFADTDFDALLASRKFVTTTEDFAFYKRPVLDDSEVGGSMWEMGPDLMRRNPGMSEAEAAHVVADRLRESLRRENDPQLMADLTQLNTIAALLRANNGSNLAADLYSPLTGLNVEAMKKLTHAQARDLINALKNEA